MLKVICGSISKSLYFRSICSCSAAFILISTIAPDDSLAADATRPRNPRANVRSNGKKRVKDFKSGELDIFAPPPGTRKLLQLTELHKIVEKQGLAMKLARENLRDVDEQVISSRRQFEPRASISTSYNSTTTTTYATDELPGSKTNNKSASAAISINGQIAQGLSYSFSTPSYSRSMTGAITAASPAAGKLTSKSVPTDDLNLYDPDANYSDSSQISASITANLIKGSYWAEGRFNNRKIEIGRQIGRENFRVAAIQAHIEAEQAFYDMVQKQIRLRISEKALETSKKISADLKEMVAVGESDKISLLRSEQQIANSEIELNSAKNDYSDSREKLREILSMTTEEFTGLYPDTREILKIPAPPKESKDELIRMALQNRPDLRIQELGLEQQTLDTRISGFNRLPNLDLSVSTSRSATDQGFGRTTNSALEDGPRNLSWTLSTSYQLIGNTDFDSFRKAKIALEKSRINRDKVLNQVNKEITSTLERLKIAYIRLGHAKANREVSETKVSAEYEKFIVGESDNKNLIEAQNEVTQARITELQAYIDVRNANASLGQAVGKDP